MCLYNGKQVTRATRHTEAVAVPHQLHAVLVNLDQTDRVDVGEDPAIEPTGSNLVP